MLIKAVNPYSESVYCITVCNLYSKLHCIELFVQQGEHNSGDIGTFVRDDMMLNKSTIFIRSPPCYCKTHYLTALFGQHQEQDVNCLVKWSTCK